ncbi:MAG: hypothetical protein ACE365_08245 [Gammaproteobacteria bacterium]
MFAFLKKLFKTPVECTLRNEIAQRLEEHLEHIIIHPKVILNLSNDEAILKRALKRRYSGVKVVRTLKDTKETVDMVIANLFYFQDFERVFDEVRKILKPDGLFLFSTFGPNTSMINTFMDMHDLGDLLMQKHLTAPVVESELLTIEYQTPDQVQQDIAGTPLSFYFADDTCYDVSAHSHNTSTPSPGDHVLSPDGSATSSVIPAKAGIQQDEGHLDSPPARRMTAEVRGVPDNLKKVPKKITYEIIYAHAWGSSLPSHMAQMHNGEVSIGINDIMHSK